MQDFLDSLVRLLPGLWMSLQLTILSSIFGLILGFFGGMLLRNRLKVVRFVTIIFVEILRGFPALLMLYIVYYGMPQIGVSFSSFVSAVIGLSLTLAGYTSEIFRAAIASIPRGQLEAAKALAMKQTTTVRLVTIPHVLRIAVPPLIGIIVIGFQGTSLAMSIGVTELTGRAFQFGQLHFTILHEIIVAAVLYFAATSLLIWMEVWAERRAARFAGVQTTKRGRFAALRTKMPLA